MANPENAFGAGGIPGVVNAWWYTASGAEAKARKSAAYNFAAKKARERLNKTIDAFIGETIPSIRKMNTALEQIAEFSDAIENSNQAEILREELEELGATIVALVGKLEVSDSIDPDMIRVTHSAN